MGISKPKKSSTHTSLSSLNLEGASSSHQRSGSLNKRHGKPTPIVPMTAGKSQVKNEQLSDFLRHAEMTKPDDLPKHPGGDNKRSTERRRSSGLSTFSDVEIQELKEKLEQRQKQNAEAVHA